MTQSPVLQPSHSTTHSRSESVRRPNLLIGAGGAVACAALGAAVFLVSSSSSLTKDATSSTASSAAVSAPAVAAPATVAALPRVTDRWYEESSTGVPAKPVASTPRVADRWYEDTKSAPAQVARPRASLTAGTKKPRLVLPPTSRSSALHRRVTPGTWIAALRRPHPAVLPVPRESRTAGTWTPLSAETVRRLRKIGSWSGGSRPACERCSAEKLCEPALVYEPLVCVRQGLRA
jgi:hypothetical protein